MTRLPCLWLVAAALLAACGQGDGPPELPGPGGGVGARTSSTLATDGDSPGEAPPLVDPDVPEEPGDGDALRVDVGGTPETAPAPPDPEEVKRKQAEWRRKMNEFARGLIDSFRSRVYDPARDAGLRVAEGIVRVRSGEAEGAFRVTYDVARPEGERVVVVPEGDVSALPARSDRQVLAFARLALNGPYREVVAYLPPINLWLTYSKDRAHKIVTAPAHKHDVQVSYRFDDRELISHRGISVLPAAEISLYDWTFWRGRYLLSRYTVHGTGGVCDLEYDDRGTSGVLLLRKAVLQKGERAFSASLSWVRVEAGEPGTKPR